MNNCCCAELVVDEGQQIELSVETDGGIEVGVAEQFVIGGGGNYQDKTVNITPTESAQSQTVQADVGYDALDEVEVNVAAIADDYVGSAVPRRASSSLAESGATVTAPAGYYANQASKTIQTAQWDATATKSAVSNHAVTVTPKAQIINAGYRPVGEKSGTAVTVSASELDSGTKAITSNGNSQDVVGYAAVNVAVPNSYSASDEGKVVNNGALVSQTSDTVTVNGTYDTTLINSLLVNVSGGGGSTKYETGTITLASNFSLTTSPNNIPNLQLSFKPDFFYITIDRTSYTGNSNPGAGLWTLMAINRSFSPPYATSNSATPESATSDYTFIISTSSTANSTIPTGYGVAAPTMLGSSYYSRFLVNDDGTISVGRYSTASTSMKSGTYRYFACKL